MRRSERRVRIGFTLSTAELANMYQSLFEEIRDDSGGSVEKACQWILPAKFSDQYPVEFSSSELFHSALDDQPRCVDKKVAMRRRTSITASSL